MVTVSWLSIIALSVSALSLGYTLGGIRRKGEIEYLMEANQKRMKEIEDLRVALNNLAKNPQKFTEIHSKG